MKISIPKEDVRRIMDRFACSEEEAAKAYLDAQDRANQEFMNCLEERFGDADKGTAPVEPLLFTPREIKEHLDRYVIGQEEYKKRLAIAAAYHFAMVNYLRSNPKDQSVKRFRKKNTLISGPSGSGKTYCVEVLGDLIRVPTLVVDATDYTEAGYVGKSADDMIRELVELAPGKTRLDQAGFINRYGGLIFIDEIDKKAKDTGLIGHDISREGFQRSVLKLIERKSVSIYSPFSPAAQLQELTGRDRKPDQQNNMISTENILFVLGGSFERTREGLDDIVMKRLKHKGRALEDGGVEIMGFGPDDNEKTKSHPGSYYKNAEADDYIKFGLIPELVGRSPIRTYVNLLSKNDLVRIMRDTEDSILKQYQLEFKLFKIAVDFDPEAIDYAAGMAEMRRTGARALVSVWETILTDFQFELPGSNFPKLRVTRELCEHPNDCLLKMLRRSPFVDFTENFLKEYGVELVLDEDTQKFVEEESSRTGRQISEILKKLFQRASALNYMGIREPFTITPEMLQDEKYFDSLFSQWYEEQKKNGRQK